MCEMAGSCTDIGVLTGEECKGKVGKLNIANIEERW